MTAQALTLTAGLTSVAQEVVVLLVFFATWSLTSHYRGRKAADPAKAAAAKTDVPSKQKLVMQLCADQFTRALRLYREMVKKDEDKQIVDPAFFSAVVEAAIRVGKTDVALQVLSRMTSNGMPPASSFLQSVLKMLSARKQFGECCQVYYKFGLGTTPEPIVYSCLILAGAETGDLDLARTLLFEQPLPCREAIPLFRAYARGRNWQAASSDLRRCLSLGMELDTICVNSTLAACNGDCQAVVEMRSLLDALHAYEPLSHVDVVSYNTLMKAYARNHDVKACFTLLETLIERKVQPDCVTFSTLLDVCIQEDEHDLASVALERMQSTGTAMTCVLLTTLMKGFVKSRRLDKALELYANMRKPGAPVAPDMITYSLLIKACCDATNMDQALSILDDMLQSSCDVDDVVFTHLIDGCCHVNNVKLAEKLFGDMVAAKIKPSIYALTGLAKVYGKCGQSEKAVEVVCTMEAKYGVTPTVVVYTCVVSGLLRQKKFQQAYMAFQQMRGHCACDTHCVQTMLTGLADGQMFPQLVTVAKDFLSRGEPRVSPECFSLAVDKMLARGSVGTAQELAQAMAEHGLEVSPQAAARLA